MVVKCQCDAERTVPDLLAWPLLPMIGRSRKKKCLLPLDVFGSEMGVIKPKNNIQMKTLLALVLLCATGVQAQILIYKRAVHSTVMGHGFTTKSTVAGYLVVDMNSGSAAEFDLYSKAKEFLNRGKTFTAGIVHGGQGRDYVVFGDAAAGTDNLGPYKSSLTARGTGLSMDIGLAGNRPVARTLRLIGRSVYFIGTETFIEEQAGTLVIDVAGTREANSAGKTLDDMVTSIRSNLIASGYKDIHP